MFFYVSLNYFLTLVMTQKKFSQTEKQINGSFFWYRELFSFNICLPFSFSDPTHANFDDRLRGSEIYFLLFFSFRSLSLSANKRQFTQVSCVLLFFFFITHMETWMIDKILSFFSPLVCAQKDNTNDFFVSSQHLRVCLDVFGN